MSRIWPAGYSWPASARRLFWNLLNPEHCESVGGLTQPFPHFSAFPPSLGRPQLPTGKETEAEAGSRVRLELQDPRVSLGRSVLKRERQMHLLLLPMKGAGQLAPAAGVPRETFCILRRAALVLLPPRGGPGVCEPDCGQEGLKNSRRRGTMKADLVARGPQPWVSASLSPMVGAGGLHLKSMDPLASGIQL